MSPSRRVVLPVCCLVTFGFVRAADAVPRRIFEVDFVSTSGSINNAMSAKVAAASFTDPEASPGRFCTGSPCIIVNESNEPGVTGIFVNGVQLSTESPLGRTVRFELDERSAVVYYDGVHKASAGVDWPEPSVRFWFRVRAGGSIGENGVGTFDNFKVDGALVDGFNLADGSPPDPLAWTESNTAQTGGDASILGNGLRIESIRTGGAAVEAVRWLRHTQTYALPPAIPTLSTWGVLAMGLLLAVGGTLAIRRMTGC